MTLNTLVNMNDWATVMMMMMMMMSHRQNILHGDDKHVVANQTVPVHQDRFNWFQQQFSTHQEEVETGHQVTHTEDTDPGTNQHCTVGVFCFYRKNKL